MRQLLARNVLALVQARAARRFAKLCERPAAAQRETLLRILRRNADTEYGRQYGFAEIRDARAYQARVPVVTADDLAPLVARMAAGEERVLTAQHPHYFCQTGGTSGEPKLSPVTRDYTKEYQETVQVWGYHVRRKYPAMMYGRILYFVGTAEAGRTEAGIPFGTMTGYTFNALPGFLRTLYALPYEISRVADYEAKYYAVLRLALVHDVRMAISVTPSTLLVLGRKLQEHQDRLIADIEAGTLNPDLEIPAESRAALAPFLRPDPGCAARLREVARGGKPLRLDQAWPHLQVVACWKSGPSAAYIEQLRDYYGATPVWDAIYSATEGWMTVPMSDVEVGGAIAVGTHFMEFFPEADTERTGPALLAEELKEGERYAVILTASSGMYRYDIKDVVTCVGKYKETPMIAFSHKEAGFSNLVGEKLSEAHVNVAMAAATAEAGLELAMFAVAPADGMPRRYVVHLEPAGEATEAALRTFLATFERVLSEQAWEYASHREAGDLEPAELAVLAPGSIDAHRRAFQAGGGNEAQMKPTHLLASAERLSGLEVTARIKGDA